MGHQPSACLVRGLCQLLSHLYRSGSLKSYRGRGFAVIALLIRHAAHIYRLLIVCDVIAACLCPTQALAPNTYRLRLLNGCNARVLKIQFLK